MAKALIQKTKFYDVWNKFASTGICEWTPANIQASWKRCNEMGFDPRKAVTAMTLDDTSIRKRIRENHDLHQLLIAHHDNIIQHFDALPLAILFSDSDGYLLSASGHDEILALLEQGNVKTGTSIHESSIGTSAPGICLAERRPVGVIAEEHYFQAFHWASCIATPILDQQNNLIGSLDFTSTVEHGRKLNNLVPLLHGIAKSIRFELWLKRKLQQFEIYDSYFQNTFHYSESALLLVDPQGEIVEFNRAAKDLFQSPPNEILYRNVRTLLGKQTGFDLSTKRKGVEKLTIQSPTGLVEYSMESIPFFDRTGTEIAILLKLERLRKSTVTPMNASAASYRYQFEDIIGGSKAIAAAIDTAGKVARTQSSLLIEGETGTGKEMFAQAVHSASQRSCGPFIALNCAAIPHELIESELFGYEKGAYSGARREGNVGKFELAHGGTLFLDEIHAMDRSAQMKILRVIEDRHVTRIGGKSPVSLNIRIIAASSVNLEKEMEKGAFLSALYFRLNVVKLRIPPLRERQEDIPVLVDYFIQKANSLFDRSIEGVDAGVFHILSRHTWPGNVRELKNCIECAFNLCEGSVITHQDINIGTCAEAKLIVETEKKQTMEGLTKTLLVESLNRFGNVKKAAAGIGISVSTFYRKMKKYDISI